MVLMAVVREIIAEYGIDGGSVADNCRIKY
jgi:hypothetical protein